MLEKIISIEEQVFKSGNKYSSTYEGYIITTDKQTIKVGITNDQSCCESFGYLSSEDDLSDFIGSKLLSISVVDEYLNSKDIPNSLEYLDEGAAMFINFETSKGLFQLVCYNSHNGYYSHYAVLISKELNHSQSL